MQDLALRNTHLDEFHQKFIRHIGIAPAIVAHVDGAPAHPQQPIPLLGRDRIFQAYAQFFPDDIAAYGRLLS